MGVWEGLNEISSDCHCPSHCGSQVDFNIQLLYRLISVSCVCEGQRLPVGRAHPQVLFSERGLSLGPGAHS